VATQEATSIYEVRLAAPGDLAGLRFIDPLLRADPDRAEAVQHTVEHGRCLAAIDGGDDVAGYVVVHDHFLGQAFVMLLVVGPAYKRQGIGTLLLRAAERACGRKKLFTSCNRSNLPAQCLFEKCGFQRSGQIYNLDEGDPEFVYFKALVT
jgi:ribosomal protein S18 acetylase RimI-like enzyme